jgi:outer membrane receptor protein involved in Fe transport
MVHHLLLAAAPLAFTVSPDALLATPTAAALVPDDVAADEAAVQANQAKNSDVVTTGVARGRDRLDSAVSTSTLRETEILNLAPRSVADLLRSVPGVRSEASTGEGNSSISIRGLPIAAAGSKFLQLQEDGLPVLEFGDTSFAASDTFLRADLNLAQVDVIRGGSASTFASNSPGGIINFVSKSGEVEGGAIQVTGGLDYDHYRLDVDYGGRISETLRFHVGGFYRQGEGPRRVGYDANKGGQIKVNVTKDFAGGYIRFHGKYLDDRTPLYDTAPMLVGGTNDDPQYAAVAGFDPSRDALLSRYLTNNLTLDTNNNFTSNDFQDGQHSRVKAFGVETQFEMGEWNVSERFRYADISAHVMGTLNASFLPASTVGFAFGGGPGATFRYASGPDAGQAIASPSTLNGNGLLSPAIMLDTIGGFDNAINDLRLSRVWKLGAGDLTTTAGLYSSRQTIDLDLLWTTALLEVRGDGKAALIDLVDAAGQPVTQGGYFGFGSAFLGGNFHSKLRVRYAINAPFGSLNYKIGRFAFGASVRYDAGSARGSQNGPGALVSRDIDNDGTLSAAERRVATLALDRTTPVDYDYGLLSYSAGINFRIAEPLAVFARYSRGGRANAERFVLGQGSLTAAGGLTDKSLAIDEVRQAEAGVKYRRADLTVNLTAFSVASEETNVNSSAGGAQIRREYGAKGLEFEGGYRMGPFALTAAATYTDAEITRDFVTPELEGNVPRRQAKLIFQASPQVTTDRFAAGTVFIGTTGSFASDTNELKMPGYVTTNAFVQVRPAERLVLSVNANNLFDVTALTGVDANVIPVSGVVSVRPLNGRTVSATARFEF